MYLLFIYYIKIKHEKQDNQRVLRKVRENLFITAMIDDFYCPICS